MNDRQLIFENIIPLEVYTETGPASLVITLNDKKVFTKVYAESTTHKETVRFEAEHDDGAFNKLSFAFSGPPLTANKHLRGGVVSVPKSNKSSTILYTERQAIRLGGGEKSTSITVLDLTTNQRCGIIDMIIAPYCTNR